VRGAPVEVYPWPLPEGLKLREIAADPLVVSVATADSAIRHDARAKIRAALRDVLSLQHAVPAELVELVTQPGQAPYAVVRGMKVHLSISHEPGCSIAALSRHPAGVDLMRVSAMPDWEAVMQDYLPPEAAKRIRRQPPDQRERAFALEWTALEAALKCLGMALEEQSQARDARLGTCKLRSLDFSRCDGCRNEYVGTLADLAETTRPA
jgi:4'-phosphopantetheinyl transferase